MRPSVLLNSLALLAVFAVAAATYCTHSSYGNIYTGYPKQYPPYTVYGETELRYKEICATKKQGVDVTVCWDAPLAASVQILSLDTLLVLTSVPAAVYVNAYCAGPELQPLNAARPHSETVNLPLIGGALPHNVGVPGAGAWPVIEAVPVREAVPVPEAVPGDRYHQLYLN